VTIKKGRKEGRKEERHKGHSSLYRNHEARRRETGVFFTSCAGVHGARSSLDTSTVANTGVSVSVSDMSHCRLFPVLSVTDSHGSLCYLYSLKKESYKSEPANDAGPIKLRAK